MAGTGTLSHLVVPSMDLTATTRGRARCRVVNTFPLLNISSNSKLDAHILDHHHHDPSRCEGRHLKGTTAITLRHDPPPRGFTKEAGRHRR